MSYSSKQKKHILDKINGLSTTEHEEIFNILQKVVTSNPSITYTVNKNGVFFNLSTLDDEVLHEIESFVDFCHHNKKELDEYDKILNDCKANTNVINLNLEHIVEKRRNGSKKSTALPICDWNSVNLEQVADTKNVQKITAFIERLNGDKTCKKKINVKFHNAKKKYGKRVLSDSKFEHDLLSDLLPEEYVFKE